MNTVFFRKTPLPLKTPPLFLTWQHRTKMPHMPELVPESTIYVSDGNFVNLIIVIAPLILTPEELSFIENERATTVHKGWPK